MTSFVDYYEVLGVGRGATRDQLKRAYRRLALLHHPDKNRDAVREATQAFQGILAAFETLSDPGKKAEYDREWRRREAKRRREEEEEEEPPKRGRYEWDSDHESETESSSGSSSDYESSTSSELETPEDEEEDEIHRGEDRDYAPDSGEADESSSDEESEGESESEASSEDESDEEDSSEDESESEASSKDKPEEMKFLTDSSEDESEEEAPAWAEDFTARNIAWGEGPLSWEEEIEWDFESVGETDED